VKPPGDDAIPSFVRSDPSLIFLSRGDKVITCVECGQHVPTTLEVSHRNITIGCGVVVVNERTEFLILRRIGGWWPDELAVVGGHPEEGETVYDCAVREVLEETGLIVVPRIVNGHSFIFHAREWISKQPFKHHFSVYVVADAVGGQLRNREPDKHKDLCFITLDEAKRLGSAPLLPLEAIEEYRDEIFG
jgi:8-oxo-dGTP diphosphatase